jgi:hypothetical protein
MRLGPQQPMITFDSTISSCGILAYLLGYQHLRHILSLTKMLAVAPARPFVYKVSCRARAFVYKVSCRARAFVYKMLLLRVDFSLQSQLLSRRFCLFTKQRALSLYLNIRNRMGPIFAHKIVPQEQRPQNCSICCTRPQMSSVINMAWGSGRAKEEHRNITLPSSGVIMVISHAEKHLCWGVGALLSVCVSNHTCA